MIVRTTAPIAMNAMTGRSTQNRTAYVGESAATTCGGWAMCGRPRSASVANHRTMTGPKSRPTAAVPKRWTAKRTVRIVTETGRMNRAAPGATISTPSTADITEMAGVITESP